MAADAVRRRLRRHPLADRVRRAGTDPRAPGRVDHRVRARPGAAVPEHGRLRADRLGAAGLRHAASSRRSTCGRSSPASGSGASCSASPTPGPTWPSLSTRAELDGDRYVVERPEGVVLQRPGRRLGHPHGAHRPRPRPRTRASRSCCVDMALAGGRAAPAAPDERRVRVRRGVPDRRRGPRRPTCSGPSTRAGWSACPRSPTSGATSARRASRCSAASTRCCAMGGDLAPLERQALVELWARGTSLWAMGRRQGPVASVLGSVAKLGTTELMFDLAVLRADLAGPEAMLDGPDAQGAGDRAGHAHRGRHVGDPAQHHRRAHPRAAQGAEGATTDVASGHVAPAPPPVRRPPRRARHRRAALRRGAAAARHGAPAGHRQDPPRRRRVVRPGDLPQGDGQGVRLRSACWACTSRATAAPARRPPPTGWPAWSSRPATRVRAASSRCRARWRCSRSGRSAPRSRSSDGCRAWLRAT